MMERGPLAFLGARWPLMATGLFYLKCLVLLPVTASTETRSNCRLAEGPVHLRAGKKKIASDTGKMLTGSPCVEGVG